MSAYNSMSVTRFDACSGFRTIGYYRAVYPPDTLPNPYICAVKLHKALKALSNQDIKALFKKKMSSFNLQRYLSKLRRKINVLIQGQYIQAIRLLYSEGVLSALAYVIHCPLLRAEEETPLD